MQTLQGGNSLHTSIRGRGNFLKFFFYMSNRLRGGEVGLLLEKSVEKAGTAARPSPILRTGLTDKRAAASPAPTAKHPF